MYARIKVYDIDNTLYTFGTGGGGVSKLRLKRSLVVENTRFRYELLQPDEHNEVSFKTGVWELYTDTTWTGRHRVDRNNGGCLLVNTPGNEAIFVAGIADITIFSETGKVLDSLEAYGTDAPCEKKSVYSVEDDATTETKGGELK